MSDSTEYKEVKETGGDREATQERLSPRGVNSMRGSDGAAERNEVFPDRSYTDAKGRELTMHTYSSGDNYYVRVFDKAKTPHPPAQSSFGDAGRANLHLERDVEGRVERARLQDIDTTPGYEGAGTGSHMIEQCETIARQKGAREVYGTFSAEPGKAGETRRFYEKRGYRFGHDGEQLSKEL